MSCNICELIEKNKPLFVKNLFKIVITTRTAKGTVLIAEHFKAKAMPFSFLEYNGNTLSTAHKNSKNFKNNRTSPGHTKKIRKKFIFVSLSKIYRLTI